MTEVRDWQEIQAELLAKAARKPTLVERIFAPFFSIAKSLAEIAHLLRQFQRQPVRTTWGDHVGPCHGNASMPGGARRDGE